MYIVMMDWYNCTLDIEEKEQRMYFFDDAEEALFFAQRIDQCQSYWEKYDKPSNMYLYYTGGPVDGYPAPNECYCEDQRYITAWLQCDTHIKSQFINMLLSFI